MRNFHSIAIISCLLLACGGNKLSHQEAMNSSPDAGNDNPNAAPVLDGGVFESKPLNYSSLDNTCNNQDCFPRSIHCWNDGKKCGLEEECRGDGDCGSGVCDYRKKCIEWKSCKTYYGGMTCGVGEVGDPAAKHESCCETNTLPSGVKLDKYLLTAGRARVMINEVNGNFKGWYLANRDTLRSETKAQIDPFVDLLPDDMRVGPYSIVAQVNGGNIYEKDLPSESQGCFEKSGSAGTHTYWLTPEDNALYGDSNGLDQDTLDSKPLNCAPYPLFAILCAFDGGRLWTWDEAKVSYGNATYPWGETPLPGGFGKAGNVVGPSALPNVWGPDAPACPTCDTTLMNWTNNYTYPIPTPSNSFDYSYFISAPGRFPKDKGPFGTQDVGGDMITWTGTVEAGYTDTKGRTNYMHFGGNSSWEGHNSTFLWTMPPSVKYSKFSGRCSKY